MVDLTQTLIAATHGDRNAETTLDEWLKANLTDLLKALAMEIATDGKPFPARQMACLYLKNTLAAQSETVQREKHARWKSLDAATRNAIKEPLLQAMKSSTEPALPHFVAVTAAEIAAVELPYNEWPQFVPSMMAAVTSDVAEHVKLACLECLGFTCERIAIVEDMLASDNIPELATETVDSMLTTIVEGVQPSRTDKMRYFALQALKNSLTFVRKNMEVKNERDFIVNAICEATRSNTSEVRALAYQCLEQMAEFFYEKLQDYMSHIFRLTVDAIQNDSEEAVKMAAIEFWTTLSLTEQCMLDEELQASELEVALSRPACPQYVKAAMESLVPLILETLTHQEEDAEEDSWNLQASAGVCLEAVSQTVENLIIPLVIPFVQQHIGNENWRYRDAAVVAFASILDGPSTAEIGSYVSQSVTVLLKCFNDPISAVRDSAVHCIAQICKLHLQAVPAEWSMQMLQGLILKLEDRPRIAAHACSGIYNIANTMKLQADQGREATNLLSQPMLALLQALLKTSDRADAMESNLRVAAMTAAAELIDAAAQDVQPILRDLLPAIVERLYQAVHMPTVSSDEKEHKELLMGQLCSLVAVLFQRMTMQDVLPHADRVMQLLLQILEMKGASCQDEALLAVSAMAFALEKEFAKYLTAFTPYLIQSLRAFQITSLCRLGIGLVVDICNNVGAAIQPFCDDIMAALLECLKDPSVDREVKPAVFSCFGDIATAIGAAYEPYLPLSIMFLMQAAQQPAPEDDEDLAAFVNSLRSSILEAYSGIVIGLNDGNALHLFVPNLPSILQFLQYLAMPGSNKDVYVLQKAVSLLGDIAQSLGTTPAHLSARQQIISQSFVATLIQEGLQAQDSSCRDSAAWARDVIQQAANTSG